MSTKTSKESALDLNIDKRFLSQYVAKKINYSINTYHILAVIGFLFDEIMIELSKNKPIIIGKFGKFFMKTMKSKRFFNIIDRKIDFTKEKKVLRFQFNKDIQEILTDNLDIAKTFEDLKDE